MGTRNSTEVAIDILSAISSSSSGQPHPRVHVEHLAERVEVGGARP